MSVAKEIDFADKYESMGAQLVRQVASDTNDIAGDGTTTATILTRAIFSAGVKSVATGLNPMEVRRGILDSVQIIANEIDSFTKEVETDEEIAQVSSSNS